jgi:predicted TIM-barrel fold metal-dependent hydrolase
MVHSYRGLIDCHAHPRGLGDSEELNVGFINDLVRYSRKLGIVRMVTLGEVLFKESGYTAEEIRRLNDRNAELVALHPDFFIPFCFLDPMLGTDFIADEVTRCYEVHGFRRVKLEICCNVAHPATIPVFENAVRHGFPLLVHAADTSIIGNREHQSDPEDVRSAALRHPFARIIMAHLTGVGVRGVQAVRDLDNVVIDTSGMQPEAGIVEYGVRVLGSDRILFGTDAWNRDVSAQIAQVAAAEIDEKKKRRLFRENAVAWLKLEGNEVPTEAYGVD